MKKNLVLVGMMGVGKTSVGKIVAKKLNMKFIDTDLNIEKKCLMKIAEIFNQKGENFFRIEEEKEVIKSLRKTKSVIAIGGGAFINKNLRNIILKDSISIWLDIDTKILHQRTKRNKKRPLLNKKNNQKTIDELYLKRKSIYQYANHKIDCNKLDKENIAKKIIIYYEA